MTESSHDHLVPEATLTTRSWDITAIAEILGVPVESRVDQVHGAGARYRLGNPPTTELEIFPVAGSVKLTTERLAVSLVHQDPPLLSPAAIVFASAPDLDTQWLSISSQGGATMLYKPRSLSHEMVAEPSILDDHLMTSPDGHQPLSPDSVPSQEASMDAVDGLENGDTRARLRLAGRLGTDIHFRTTRHGKLVASFPLAITKDDGSVQWQNVLVFNERAEKLRSGEVPRKGQFCDIVGYRHEKEVKGKDGTVRTVEEVYAVVVKPR